MLKVRIPIPQIKSGHLVVAYLCISCILLGCLSKTGHLSYQRSMIIFSDSISVPDPHTLSIIKPYKDSFYSEMNDVLIVSDTMFVKGQPESMLGNLIADLTLKKGQDYINAPIDICLLNNGGLRTALPKGNITRGKIFELMPFENEIVILTLSGEKTQQMFNYIARSEGMPVSGIKMGIKNGQAVKVLINGEPFDPEKEYSVITSDYLANGGDKMSFFKDPIKIESLHKKLRDVIIEFLLEEKMDGKKLTSKVDGRVYIHE